MLTVNFANFTAQTPDKTDLKKPITTNNTAFSAKLAPLKMDCVSFKATEGKVIDTTGDVNITKKDGLIKSIRTTGNVNLSDGAHVTGDVIAKGDIYVHDGPATNAKRTFMQNWVASFNNDTEEKKNVNKDSTIIDGNVISTRNSVLISGAGTRVKKDVSAKMFVGIASGAVVEGNATSSESCVGLCKKGTTVKKDIVAEDSVYINKGAVVEGNIESQAHVFVADEGTLVKGTAKAKGSVIVKDGAKVLGNG